MRFVTEWVTPDRRRLVVLSPDVIATLTRYRQRFFWQTEAGGILLGRRRGSHIEVVLATVPTQNDRRSTFRFQREAWGMPKLQRTPGFKLEAQPTTSVSGTRTRNGSRYRPLSTEKSGTSSPSCDLTYPSWHW